MLLTLNEDQVIQDTLIGVNINAENLTILGLLNSENLTQIYENTFMVCNNIFNELDTDHCYSFYFLRFLLINTSEETYHF